VENVFETGDTETVYNFRVADWHTYFVGDKDWDFEVWVHNACGPGANGPSTTPKRIQIDASKAPKSAQHLEDVGAVGKPFIVNRPGAHQNRADALRGKPKVAGYDLDEAPPAVLRQPGDPVSVRPIIPGDNRSGGSQIGNQLRDVPNGSQIIIIIINKLN